MLRFHLHPSQCRSIGQAIGLTAYPPQRAAIFTMPLLTRTLPRLFSVGSLIRAFGHSDHMWSLLALAGLYDSTPNIPWTRFTFKRSLTPRLKSGACARANLGQRSDSSSPTGSRYRYIEGLRAKKSQSSSTSTIRLAAARMGLVVVFIESIEVARNPQLSDSEELFRVSGEHPEQGSYD